MRVYLDTGVFVDYLIYRGHAGHFLRKRGRRNRTIQQLHQDVSECLEKIEKSHSGFTSCLTLYEAEEALFAKLIKSSNGIKDGRRFAVISSRNLGAQMLAIRDYFGLGILDLSEDIILKELEQIDLQTRGIRAGDSLHVVTAIQNDAEMIITTDRHLLNLDKVFRNNAGTCIQCVDTNDAKHLL